MKLSVVMTYHNRPDQFDLTLRSIQEQGDPDLELIVVDDASDEDLKARHVLDRLGVEAKLIEITEEEKYWVNPSVPYNMGFSEVTGDVVVIQNAEAAHVGQVFREIRCKVSTTTYIVAPCYSTTENEFHRLCGTKGGAEASIRSVVEPNKRDQWYHHPQLFPKWYHFCSAMTTDNLQRLGGFNEAFAAGYCFEDNEFLLRIRKRLKLTVDSMANGTYVIHQWHPKNPAMCGGCDLWERNRKLYALIEEQLK